VIYFARQTGQRGPIKIGLTQNVDKRLRLLCANCPTPIEFAATIEGGIEIESRFHERFLDQQSHYEWFHWSPELQQTIDDINAGTFDIETLPMARGPAPTQRGRPSHQSPERSRWMLELAP
jgi:hypothetical protein